MNSKLLAAVILLGSLAGCVGDDAPIFLGNFKPFDPGANCSPVADARSASTTGALDVAGGATYLKFVEVISQLSAVPREGGEATSPNEAIIDRVQVSYRSTPSIALPDASYPLHFVIAPASSDNLLAVDLFPPAALEALNSGIGTEPVTVYASLSLSGKLRAGSSFTSSEATFPIRVTRGQRCPLGQVPAIIGFCGEPGGQDGIPVLCCPESNPFCLAATE